MNLSELFPIQAEFDNRIVTKFGLEGQDLLPKKILALQVELGELANEARFFKFWSEDQMPRDRVFKTIDVDILVLTNPLLEEYADSLHFILSIGLELNIPVEWDISDIKTHIYLENDLTQQFILINHYLDIRIDASDWFVVIELFLGLGDMLGFTSEEIYNAYLDKNKINITRLESGY